jgi:branched-chain amino acid transport system permease protein
MTMLHYIRKGRGTDKILFIHGNAASANWWGPVMDRLADDFDMLAIDLAGYGQSGPGPEDVTIEYHGRQVAQILHELEFTPCVVVGHSLGGAVAMELAATMPRDMLAMVLVDSAPITPMAPFDVDLLTQMVANDTLLQNALKATFVREIDADLQAVLMADCLQARAAFLPNSLALTKCDFTTRTKDFHKPVLVVWGEKDLVISWETAQQSKNAYANSRFAMLEQAGHNPQVEVPGEFSSLLKEFIQTLQKEK